MPRSIGIEQINRAFKESASKLAHSKGFAADKNYTALGVPGSAGSKSHEALSEIIGWS
jgi:hypothetical protein